MIVRKRLGTLAVSFAVLLAFVEPTRAAKGDALPAEDEAWSGCHDAARTIERAEQAPAFILAALTMTESGRRAPSGGVRGWPWTIYARGRGYYFATKESAVSAVRRLRAEGVRAIDVGCAQINLRYHPKAFETLEEAFDPVANVTYALRFLRELHARFGSWDAAIASYHSVNPVHQTRYKKRVLSAWIEAEREDAAFWHKSDVLPAASMSPGNELALSEEPSHEPELAVREGRRSWTRWMSILAPPRMISLLSTTQPVKETQGPSRPIEVALAHDSGQRLRP